MSTPTPQPPTAPQNESGYPLAALIVGALGLLTVGVPMLTFVVIPLGIWGLFAVKKGQKGRWMVWTGLTIGILRILIVANQVGQGV